MTALMAPSLSFKSFSLAVATLGFTGLTAPGGGARPVPPPVVPPPFDADGIGSIDPLTLKRAPDGLFYVTAAVNGVPVRFVVDTGANVVVLTRADAAAAGVIGSPTGGRALRTAGGTAAMRWATIDRLTIGDRAIAGADAAIVGDNGLPHSLLGQSVLSRLDSVTLRGNRLQLR
jgi:aspartyl protease family protein